MIYFAPGQFQLQWRPPGHKKILPDFHWNLEVRCDPGYASIPVRSAKVNGVVCLVIKSPAQYTSFRNQEPCRENLLGLLWRPVLKSIKGTLIVATMTIRSITPQLRLRGHAGGECRTTLKVRTWSAVVGAHCELTHATWALTGGWKSAVRQGHVAACCYCGR